MIIGIAGTLGSGKGTVVEYLKTKGFTHYSSSGTLCRMLEARGESTTRENLSHLANQLAQEYTGGILEMSHQFALAAGDTNYILESIHRVKEAAYIRSIGGVILGVDADIEIRYSRISKRQEGQKDNVSFEQFVADSQREDDGATNSGPNIRAVIGTADFIIVNNGTLTELYSQIDNFFERFNKTI
jgi:dephospho-CoA kinase